MNAFTRTLFLMCVILNYPLLGVAVAPPDVESKRLLLFIEKFDKLEDAGGIPVGLISTSKGDWRVLALRRDLGGAGGDGSLVAALASFREQFSKLFIGAYTYQEASLRIAYRHTPPWGGAVWIIGYTPHEDSPLAGTGFKTTFFVPIYPDGALGVRAEPVLAGDRGR